MKRRKTKHSKKLFARRSIPKSKNLKAMPMRGGYRL